MSSVKIVQIKCPNCGGQLNNVGPFSTTKVCGYCHKEFQVTGTMDKEMDTPDRIVTFKTSKEDFERELLAFLAKEDYAPNDIFDLTEFANVDGIYLPMYLYEGKYESSWNCSVGYSENEVVASSDGKSVKNTTVIKYRPQSGTTKSDYAFVCLAYEGEEVKEELVNYARTFNYDKHGAKAFEPKFLEGFNFMLHNLDKEATWDKWGADTIDYIAEQNSISQVPGETYKDFIYSVSTDTKHDGRLVFIPFWMVYYTYNDEQHHVIMDGTGNNGITGSTPIDWERKAAVQKWYDIAKYVKWGAWASLGFLLLHFFWYAPAAVWIAFFAIKFYAKSNERKILDENKAIRRKKLAEILDENDE